MNLFLFILSAAGLCYGLESTHHYKYKYSGNFKVGIPDDGNQETGLAMKAIVDVFVENNDGFAILKLSDVSILSFNEDLGGINEDFDFTDERFHRFEDEELERIFEQPFRVNLRDSEPFAIEYAATEHRWLSNVRKGIASMLKNEILKGNFVTQVKDSIPSLFHQGHLVNNFYVDEETIFGICKAKYNIHQIPDSMFTGSNELTPTRQDGAKNDLWHVTRTIDFDKCSEIVALHVHTTNNRRHKHKKLKFTRTSVSSYVLRGSPGHFDLYSVLTEGATTYPLSLLNENEAAQSTVKQKLVLIDEGNSEVLPELGANLTHSTTWMHQVWSPFQRPKEGKPHPWIVYANKREPDIGYEIFGAKKYNADQIAAVKANILELIKDASKRLTDLNQEAEDPPSIVISDSLELATLYFRYLKKEHILKIFDHIFERKVGIERQLVMNAAAASGFSEAMEAILDYMEGGKMEHFQVFTTLMTLSRNSFGSLNISRIMDFLLGSKEPSEYLLNFAHYLSEYCIHKVHNYVPTAGDAECHSSFINTRFIPYLKEIIYNEELTWERGYAVKVLTLLRSGFTFEIVSPFIDGRMNSSVALKAMAVRALENWSIYPEMTMKIPIIDLLTDVYSDVSQDLRVRTAALLAIISWEPNTKFWYNLALKSWNDPSNEFVSFASSLIKTYAEDNLPSLEKQSKGAAYALKFSKPPTKTSNFYNIGLLNDFFNRQAKFSIFSSSIMKSDYRDSSDDFFSILSNIEGLNIYKLEKYQLYGERNTNFNKTIKKDYSNIPDAKDILDNLYNEIHFKEHPNEDASYQESFIEIFNDLFLKVSSIQNHLNVYLNSDQSDPSTFYWGAFFYLMDKSDFHPNELGLPLYTFSALPTTVGFTTKLQNQEFRSRKSKTVVKLSSVYSKGISIFLPWNHQFSTAMVRSNLEIILPVGNIEKQSEGTESYFESPKNYYEISYKKKFPFIRLSNSPMTVTYDMDPIAKDVVVNYGVIKKSNVRIKHINEVNAFTGIKYDLLLRADTLTSFGVRDFLRFPDISFRVWSLDLYLEPEEFQTKELMFTSFSGLIFKSDQNEDSGSDLYTKEKRNERNSEAYNIEERSRLIRNLLKYNLTSDDIIFYKGEKFDFVGKVPRQFEIFFANREEITELEAGPYRYNFETLGFSRTYQGKLKSICFSFQSSQYLGAGKYYYDSGSTFPGTHVKEIENFDISLDCTKTIFSTNIVYNISEERVAEIKKYCKSNYGEESCYVGKDELLAFDDIHFTIHTNENGEAKNGIHFIQILFDILSVKSFGYEIPRNNSQFRIRRNTHHGNWDLYLKYESEDFFLSTFSNSIILKLLAESSTPFHLIDLVIDISAGELKPRCILTNNSVETFDGVNFNYELSNCWTLASQTKNFHQHNVFLIRKAQGQSSIPDFKYFMFDSGTVIDFSNNELKVNGSMVDRIREDDHDSSVTVVKGFIYKKGHTYLIYTEGKYERPDIVVSTNKIEFHKEIFYLTSNGICGNGDGEKIAELIGPKKCVYDDAQMFTASWTGQSENCDSAVLKEYRKEVEEYQTKCKPYDDQPIESVVNPRCLFFGWKILTLSDHSYCISANPLPFCSSHCDIKKVKKVEMSYKCWPKEKAPLRLRTSIENKDDVITDPVSADPYFYEFSSTEVAKICKQF